MALIPYDRTPGEHDPQLECPSGPVRELYCGDAACDCLTGHLILGGVPMAVDVGTGRLDFLDPQAGVLHEAVKTELEELVRTPGAIDLLRAHYVAVRRYGEEHNFEYEDWTKVKPGEVVPWQALYPRDGVEMLPMLKEEKAAQALKEGEVAPEYGEEDIAFRIGFSDAYCVDPRCDCQRVHWTVFGMAPGDRDAVRQLGNVVYDLRKHQPAVQATAQGVDADQLLYTVLAALQTFPGLIDAHADRYRRIRQLIIPIAQRQKQLDEKVRQDARRAVGRNDPCPCGSGKKYKKCHGAKAPGTG